MKTEYTEYGVICKFNALKLKDKVDVLSSAIDLMQQYNGRTKEECIIMAMGFERNSDGKWVIEDDRVD